MRIGIYVGSFNPVHKGHIEVINYLLDNTGNDINRVSNELTKLLNYCYDSKVITNNDIDIVVLKKIDTNIFDLIDAIISKDKKKSLEIYEEMINYGEDTFKILIALANQIRLIYQVKVLQSYANDEITKILNLKNPKQVIALRYKINKYSKYTLCFLLSRLKYRQFSILSKVTQLVSSRPSIKT